MDKVYRPDRDGPKNPVEMTKPGLGLARPVNPGKPRPTKPLKPAPGEGTIKPYPMPGFGKPMRPHPMKPISNKEVQPVYRNQGFM